MKVVNSRRELIEALDGMPQWPGMPEGFCAIVTRLQKDTPEFEEVVVLGYLRKNSAVFPPEMLFGRNGEPLTAMSISRR